MGRSLDDFYISNIPHIITFVITRNPRSTRRGIETALKDNQSDFFGLCFGRFDFAFEIRAASPEAGFETLGKIRTKFLKKPRSSHFAASLLPLLCYSIRQDEEPEENSEDDFPYRAYSVFRIVKNRTSLAFKALQEIKSRQMDVEAEILWTPSLMSYILKLSGRNFDSLSNSLYQMRLKALPVRDYCTFITISKDFIKESLGETCVSAAINIKLGDSRLLGTMLKLPSTSYRLGYFDIIRDVTMPSPQHLLKEVGRIRRLFKVSGPPNWTGTVLRFDPTRTPGVID